MRVFQRPVVPPRRPVVDLARLTAYLRHAGFNLAPDRVAVLFVRGYYLDGHGDRGRNDHNTYDDAAFVLKVVGKRIVWAASYNANADPRAEGVNRAIDKGWPTLQPGVHAYRFGFHRGKYLALKPYTTVPVVRSGETEAEQNASINIHAGGRTWTWSWGCMTVISAQYGPRSKSLRRSGDGFIDRVWSLAAEFGQGCSLAPDGRAGFRALPRRTKERSVPVVVVDEAAFRAAR